MRLTRRQRKERKARGLLVGPTVLESSRSLFDTLDRIMPREILAPLNEADAWRLREMSVAGTPAEIAAGAERVMASVWTQRHGGGATLTVGGEVIAEIEPMGGGWWVGVGDGDLVNGTLQEAKVRALEMLSGVSS